MDTIAETIADRVAGAFSHLEQKFYLGLELTKLEDAILAVLEREGELTFAELSKSIKIRGKNVSFQAIKKAVFGDIEKDTGRVVREGLLEYGKSFSSMFPLIIKEPKGCVELVEFGGTTRVRLTKLGKVIAGERAMLSRDYNMKVIKRYIEAAEKAEDITKGTVAPGKKEGKPMDDFNDDERGFLEMHKKRMGRLAVISLMLIFLSSSVSAFSCYANRFMALQATDQFKIIDQKQMLEGVCFPLPKDATTQKVSEWVSRAGLEKTDSLKDYDRGVAAGYYLGTRDPSLLTSCVDAYAAGVEKTLQVGGYDFSLDCKGQLLEFNKSFVDDVKSNIIQLWNSAAVPTETTQDINAETTQNATSNYTPVLSSGEIQNIVEQKVQEQLGYIKQYSCQLSSDRKNEFYQHWLDLPQLSKDCLGTFLSMNRTDVLGFANACTFLYGNPNVAYNLLENYGDLGWAQKKCENAIVQTTSPSGTVSNTVAVCYYYPIDIQRGCLLEFQDRQGREGNVASSNFSGAFLLAFVVVLIMGFAVFYQQVKDD